MAERALRAVGRCSGSPPSGGGPPPRGLPHAEALEEVAQGQVSILTRASARVRIETFVVWPVETRTNKVERFKTWYD